MLLAWIQLWTLFRTKQATGRRYMYVHSRPIFYLDWSEHVKNWAWFQKVEDFKNENNQKVSLIKKTSNLIFSNEKKIDEFSWFLTSKDYILWKPKICHISCAQINPNQFQWKKQLVYNLAVSIFLLPIACLSLNSATVIMLMCVWRIDTFEVQHKKKWLHNYDLQYSVL